jgi:phosphoglycolate phosphatase
VNIRLNNTMKLAPPRTLLFDWDNTLVSTWPVIHRALEETFLHFGLQPWTLEQVKERVARSMREAFPELFGARAEEAALCYQERYRAHQLAGLEPLPGARELLEWARTLPALRVGIVSNKRSDALHREITHLGWEALCDVIVGAGDAEHDKPHPAPALLALSHLGQQAGGEVWFIGDSSVDLECAHTAGLTRILYGAELITHEHDAEKRFYRGWGYDALVTDHAALRRLLMVAGNPAAAQHAG